MGDRNLESLKSYVYKMQALFPPDTEVDTPAVTVQVCHLGLNGWIVTAIATVYYVFTAAKLFHDSILL